MEIARRYSISGSSVLQKRRRLGIGPIVDERPIERTPELLAMLALPQSEVARRTGVNVKTIAELRKQYRVKGLRSAGMRYGPAVVARMGKESDEAIAHDLSVSSSAVRHKRHSLSIAAYDGHRHRGRRGAARSASKHKKA